MVTRPNGGCGLKIKEKRINMKIRATSLYAPAQRAFWHAKAKEYLKDVENQTSLINAFVGYVIDDWIADINTELINQPEIIIATWDSFEKYDLWLLRSMLYPREIIRQIEKMYFKNQDEIIALLGDNDPSYISDFSADFYYCNGIDVPTKKIA